MQSAPTDDIPRRNYIRRKRCLNESVSMIEKTLFCISSIRKDPIDKKELSKMAKSHASEVEAACWAPRMKMSDDDYQSLMNSKTKELCLVLIKKLIPAIDFQRLQQETPPSASPPPERKTPTVQISQHPKPSLPQAQIKSMQNKSHMTDAQTQSIRVPQIDPLADFGIPIQDTTGPVVFSPSFAISQQTELMEDNTIDGLYSYGTDETPQLADDMFNPIVFPNM